MDPKKSIESICVKEYTRNESTKSHQLPIYATSSFEFESIEDGINIFRGDKIGHSYSRYGNPTIDTVARKIASLESYDLENEAYGYLTSSGMSAISTLALATMTTGDTLLTQANLYGGTTELFSKLLFNLGINTIFANLKNQSEVEQAIEENPSIRMIYMESPANPTLACIDIKSITSLAKQKNILTSIDNTFSTPLGQRPLTLGVDFVVHSTTKYLNGHGNSISGAIISNRIDYQQKIWTTLKLGGSTCNAWDAWLINNGIKTLNLRMERHSSNALYLAQFLESHHRVKQVNYTGLKSHPDHNLAKSQMHLHGGMLSFEIEGGLEEALTFINRTELCSMAPTLGDVDTLILHPATSSHLNVDPEQRRENGVTDGLIRVSVGIENIEDLIDDFEKCLNK